MAKAKFTAGRVTDFKCKEGKAQDFLWCAENAGLAVRATPASSANRYIFQTKVKGKTMRVTIGKVSMWSIADAQAEARRLQVEVDNGNDPRQQVADKEAAEAASLQSVKDEAAALTLQVKLESVTVEKAWFEYVKERKEKLSKGKPVWSESHYKDHIKLIHAGGETRKRSKEITKPATLAALSDIRLIDLNTDVIEEWARVESSIRPTSARLALRLLRAFLFWCARHKVYSAIVTSNPARSKDAIESLGKANVKNDVLQREQLPAWFAAVKQINNPVISAYLQTLLLTGRRREQIAELKWTDIDFQWHSITMNDKTEGVAVIPLTPYVAHLLKSLPRRNEYVFSSPTAKAGYVANPNIEHHKACAIAGLYMTLHGLRRSFATLCEWIETPAGIASQIQGHAPQGVREKNYIRRPLDLLRMWHVKIEAWMLDQAGIKQPKLEESPSLLTLVK